MKTLPYDAALYASQRSAELLPGPDAVDGRAVAQYLDRGFIAVANLLTAEEIERYTRLVEDLSGGRVESYNRVQEDRGVQLDAKSFDSDRVRKLWFTPDESRRFGLPVDHPVIGGVVAQLMEERTPALYQAMALLKPPHGGGEKPWHQDHAYFNVPLGQRIVGVWLALDPATVANGCLHLIPGEHKDGAIPHFVRRDWQICDTDILGKESVAAELPPGAALFFDGLAPHGTPVNDSNQRRRAMQFHYAPQDAPDWTDDQRTAVFGSEGRDVYC
ncbi:MAG: phytanoyl-CoA dioxygenase family protein [Planctomycetota bacterium]